MSSLEGFSEHIRGRRSLVIGDVADWLAKISAVESESLYKGRSVLVIQETVRGGFSGGPALFRKRWDCIFRIRDSFEAQMLATYVANAPKPVRILWTGSGQDIPRAFWQRWSGNDVTLIGGSGGVSGSNDLFGCEWEVIFFPLRNTRQLTDKILGMRGSGMRTLVPAVAPHLDDIAESGAALVWSNIDESDTRGALYWHDPKEGAKAEMVSKEEAVGLLEDVIRILK